MDAVVCGSVQEVMVLGLLEVMGGMVEVVVVVLQLLWVGRGWVGACCW